jgi:hypothetical protein
MVLKKLLETSTFFPEPTEADRTRDLGVHLHARSSVGVQFSPLHWSPAPKSLFPKCYSKIESVEFPCTYSTFISMAGGTNGHPLVREE